MTKHSSSNKNKENHQHNIVFKSQDVDVRKHHRDHDEDHYHYRRYRDDVLPYHDPIMRYSYQTWMSRFLSTIQDINATYPIYPTTSEINSMKNFIIALPDIVPCHTSLCKSYITTYIERNRDNLDAITVNRNYLYEFLRDFYVDIKQKFGNELYEDYNYHGII